MAAELGRVPAAGASPIARTQMVKSAPRQQAPSSSSRRTLPHCALTPAVETLRTSPTPLPVMSSARLIAPPIARRSIIATSKLPRWRGVKRQGPSIRSPRTVISHCAARPLTAPA